MGQRGPIRDPKSQRYERRSKPEPTLADIPADQLGEARMPSWLEGDARRFWKQHAPKLRELGRLTALDQVSFAVLCDSYATLRQMDRQIERDGLTIEGARGAQQPHPLLKARDTALKSFLEGVKMFGLSPTSRARLPAVPKGRRTPDEFEDFLAGRERRNGHDTDPRNVLKKNH